MCKPVNKLKKRDLEFLSIEELCELLSDENYLADPDISPFYGVHESNTTVIRQVLNDRRRASSRV